MINISNKPSKQVEHFQGTITMSFPGVKNKDWNFTVLRYLKRPSRQTWLRNRQHGSLPKNKIAYEGEE
jgi:hypothetical protein